MEYLRLFNTQANYAAAKSSLVTPNVSYIEENGNVFFNAKVPNDEIWYTSVSREAIQFSELIEGDFGATLISSTYENGKGIFKFDGPIISVPGKAFSLTNQLETIILPDGVIAIDFFAFQGCYTLSSIILPNSLTYIGNNAFYDCTSLTGIVIPNSVTNITSGAFYNCSNLTSITYNGTIAQWNSITKGSNWKYKVPATAVHCTDGDVAI